MGRFCPLMLRHSCEKQGCYFDKHMPKFQAFDGCFPRGIKFTDIDGAIEINGKFLILEFKSHRNIPLGQLRMFESLPEGIEVFVVEGDARTMAVKGLLRIYGGMQTDWEELSLPALKTRIREWADRADRP